MMKKFVPVTKLIGTFAFSFWALVMHTTLPLVCLVVLELILLGMCAACRAISRPSSVWSFSRPSWLSSSFSRRFPGIGLRHGPSHVGHDHYLHHLADDDAPSGFDGSLGQADQDSL